jgi:hypothetical protein
MIALLLALVSFNLGVEAGQLVIVIALIPIAFAVRQSWFSPWSSALVATVVCREPRPPRTSLFALEREGIS